MHAEAASGPVVLDIWGSIEPRFGGVGPAASSLATAVGRCGGLRARQIAICEPFEKERADGIDPAVERIDSPSSMRGFADFSLSKVLAGPIAAADVCHIHGLWMPHCLAARRLSKKMRKPLVSSVHGMLERWELRNKRAKKAIYSWLLERPSLSHSSCLRALSEGEVGDYLRFGVTQPIALVPNGISPLTRVATAPFLSLFPELNGKSIVLFLGRVHHKKGILNLLEAWASVTLHHKDAHLVIAGPEYADTGAKVRELIATLKLDRAVTITGVISGNTKLAALSAAKYFCLPSYSEGLSVAVLEALSIGLPAIVTPECNIPAVAAGGAGVCTSNEPGALAEALITCLGASAQEWEGMSNAAQTVARSQFDWNSVGKTMHSVYEWLLGGNRPSCVVALGSTK